MSTTPPEEPVPPIEPTPPVAPPAPAAPPAPTAFDPYAVPPAAPPAYGYAPQPGQPYANQAYPGQPYYQQAPFNTLAIVGFVLAFVVSLGAVICGHIALNQIKRTGERGHGLALAGVIIGYAGIAFGIIYVIAIIVIFASAGAAGAFSNLQN